jgi:hypothetical protein
MTLPQNFRTPTCLKGCPVNDGAVGLARRLGEEIQGLLDELGRTRAASARLPASPTSEEVAAAMREHRRMLASGRRQWTGDMAARFRARRAEMRRDWWYESDDPPPPPPGPNAGEIYRQRRRP